MGCKLVRNQHGYLSWMLYIAGRQWRERTGYRDTRENRRKLEAARAEMDARIKNGTFNYLEYFPDGNRAKEFTPAPAETLTLSTYYADTWLPRQMGRKSKLRDYQQHWRAYIAHVLGDVDIRDISRRHVEDLRVYLQAERGLAQKTAKNVVSGTLGAILQAAVEQDALVESNPVRGVRWEREPAPQIDPFTRDERDDLLAYFYEKDRRWHPFVYCQFWTGMRPSEAVALRWGCVDTRTGKIEVRVSRHLGSESATKTSASARIVTGIPNVIEMLKAHRPLRAGENDYVFTGPKGGPVDQNDFRKERWTRALRATGIRPRGFYNTRHTYISLALSAGLNIKWISENTGTSVAMIERRYGRYIPDVEDEALGRFLGNLPKSGKRKATP